MFATLVRRLPTGGTNPPPAASVADSNIYKTKKVWPPDFSQLSHQEQLKFEKRYKRRVLLKSARPRWNKAIKLTQLFSVTFVITYGALFMDWGDDTKNPFRGLRQWVWGEAYPGTSAEKKNEMRMNPRERPLRDRPE